MKFWISITCDVNLDVSQLWPDGDGPAEPTAEDVLQLIDDEGGVASILRDWNLEDSSVVIVRPIRDATEKPR